MSRTRRKYNDPNKKLFWMLFRRSTGVSFDKELGKWVCTVPGIEEYNNLKRRVMCMGRCPMCRDHKMDNVKKAEKAMVLALSVKTVDLEENAFLDSS